MRENLKIRDDQAKGVMQKDEDLLKYFSGKKEEYLKIKGEIDHDDEELEYKFDIYEGQVYEVEGDERQARDQCTQIQQRVDRLSK